MKAAVAFFLVLAPFAAKACLWDSDTLAAEAKGLPGVIEAIVGRIDVNPPLYYEMRLARVTKLIPANPRNLEAYDDAAVACDRLGKGDAAIGWISKKISHTPPLSVSTKETWYRTHANMGTFYAHKWIRIGAPSDLHLLDKAVAELEAALKINPDAHFGREIVQVNLIKLIIEDKRPAPKKHDYDESKALTDWRAMKRAIGTTKFAQGLIGIMTLGSGTESIDMISLLGHADTAASTVSYLAGKRITELRTEGKKSLFDEDSLHKISGYAWVTTAPRTMDRAYTDLRKNALAYTGNRTSFMLTKLKAGRHPDTDSDFWVGYKEVPKLDLSGYWEIGQFAQGQYLIPFWTTVISSPFVLIYVLQQMRKRRLAATSKGPEAGFNPK